MEKRESGEKRRMKAAAKVKKVKINSWPTET